MKKILFLIFSIMLFSLSLISVYAFSNELSEPETSLTMPEQTTNANGESVTNLSLSINGIIDTKTITGDASVFLMIRSIETGKIIRAPLYDFNSYVKHLVLPNPGYYEIYRAFYCSKSSGIPDNPFPIEYVMFYHPGDKNVSINVILGNPKNIDTEKLGSAYRVNLPGEAYKDKPTNIASQNVSYAEFERFGDIPLNSERNEVVPEKSTTQVTIKDFFDGSMAESTENAGTNKYEYNEDDTPTIGVVSIIVAIIVLSIGIFYYFKKIKQNK